MSQAVLAASRATLATKAQTFQWASRLLPARMRDDAAVVYAFCRLVDDTVDEAPDPVLAASALDGLEAEVLGQSPARPLVGAFREAAARLDLPLASAADLIAGARSDLGVVRVPDDAALLLYCYRVASTVGLMMCAVLGVRRRDALPHAVDLGIAMQLTNICRDVAEDAAAGRVYLPAERLGGVGLDPESLVNGGADRQAVASVVRELLALAGCYYRSADDGMRDIPLRARLAILVASRVYQAIGIRLRQQGCDALAGRTVVPWTGKVWWSCRALGSACSPSVLGVGARRPHQARLHATLHGLPGVHAPTNSGGWHLPAP